MGKKPKFSKEVKTKASQDYEKGHAVFTTIAKEIGAHEVTVLRWHQRY
ncbi:hypothetical protein CULT_1940003 [[Clostridium] ultunense Esp]|nr:hypothetical protein CULT_1940003 [[Clostridium] ultunense Esp]